MTATTTLAFVGVSALIVVTPGPHLLIVMRSALQGGRLAGLASALGVTTGTAMWAIAAVAGLTTAVAAAPEVLAAIRVLGAGYLAWLGIRSLVGPARPPAREMTGRLRTGWWPPYRIGLVSNLLHPGQVLFFASLLPQFVALDRDPAVQVAALGGIFVGIVLTWFSLFALVLARVPISPRAGAAVQRGSGVLLVALAARLVLGA